MAPIVVVVVVGVAVVIVVAAAIALPPLRLSAVEISMGACSLLSSLLFSFLLCGYCKHLLNFFVDLVSLIVTATQFASHPSPYPSLHTQKNV